MKHCFTTINKIKELPESIAEEVNDFVDFLLLKRDKEKWQLWMQFAESMRIIESDMCDYLARLEDYENLLASGEIQW